MTGPEGFNLANDDAEGRRHARTAASSSNFPADGAYRVAVTSFRAGETGAYRLQASTPAADVAVSRAGRRRSRSRIGADDQRPPRPGRRPRRPSGASPTATASTPGAASASPIALTADKMDTVLRARPPRRHPGRQRRHRGSNGRDLDQQPDRHRARRGRRLCRSPPPPTGPDATGDYRLSLAPSPGHPRQIGVPGGARVIALLVGVSDYGGRTSDLPNTDDDARELYNSLRAAGLLHPASSVLTNERGDHQERRRRLRPRRRRGRAERHLPVLLLGPWRPGRRAGQRRRAGRPRRDDRALRRGDDRRRARAFVRQRPRPAVDGRDRLLLFRRLPQPDRPAERDGPVQLRGGSDQPRRQPLQGGRLPRLLPARRPAGRGRRRRRPHRHRRRAFDLCPPPLPPRGRHPGDHPRGRAQLTRTSWSSAAACRSRTSSCASPAATQLAAAPPPRPAPVPDAGRSRSSGASQPTCSGLPLRLVEANSSSCFLGHRFGHLARGALELALRRVAALGGESGAGGFLLGG